MDKVQDWVEEWLQLWPDGVKSGGELVRSKAKYCVNKLVKLQKDNPTYTKSVIFAATQRYLAERKAEGYIYTKRATYFISKVGQESVLESYCEKVLTKEKPIEPNPEYQPIDDYI